MSSADRCIRCGKRPAVERPELRGKVLCNECAVRARDASHAASTLLPALFDWGKQVEWAGVPISVMTAAIDAAMDEFSAHILSGRPLAEGPRLLAAEVIDDELVLTMGTSESQVWRESFGSWESRNPRTIFMRVMSTGKRLGDVMTMYYWDKERDEYATRTCWAVDEQLQREFGRAADAVPGGVPTYVLRVDGLVEGRLETVRDHLADLVRYAGLYLGLMRIDKRNGFAACESTGPMTERRRELIAYLVEKQGIVRVEDLVIEEGELR